MEKSFIVTGNYVAGQEISMGQVTETQPDPAWVDDEADAYPEMDIMDEDLEIEDLDESEDLQELPEPTQESVPLWRLIEMSREDRLLKRELADFTEYEGFDSFSDFDNTGDEYAEAY
jgi:hypothetical protein